MQKDVIKYLNYFINIRKLTFIYICLKEHTFLTQNYVAFDKNNMNRPTCIYYINITMTILHENIFTRNPSCDCKNTKNLKQFPTLRAKETFFYQTRKLNVQ